MVWKMQKGPDVSFDAVALWRPARRVRVHVRLQIDKMIFKIHLERQVTKNRQNNLENKAQTYRISNTSRFTIVIKSVDPARRDLPMCH